MNHCWHRRHFQSQQVSAVQHGEFMRPAEPREICVGKIFCPHIKFPIAWIPNKNEWILPAKNLAAPCSMYNQLYEQQ